MTDQPPPTNNFDPSRLQTLDHPWQRPHPDVPHVYNVELSLQNAAGIQINRFKMPFVFSDPEEAAVCASQSFMDVFGALCDSNTQSCLRSGVAAISGNHCARLVDGSVGIVKVTEVPVWVIGDEPEVELTEPDTGFRGPRRDTVHGQDAA